MSIKIALAGNPNSGKTTMFNTLTGSAQYVGNWPGVTVERKGGKLKGDKDVLIQDLPGIYSLSPYTLEEVIARDYLVHEKPDAIINVVDASNIERNLYLTTQLLELNLPVVVALNMIDVTRKHGDEIDLAKLSKALGCEVIETSALKGDGVTEAAHRAVKLVNNKKKVDIKSIFSADFEKRIAEIAKIIENKVESSSLRWYAIKFFERDEQACAKVTLSDEESTAIEAVIAACERERADDSESIVADERYNFIVGIVEDSVVRKNLGQLTTADKIDRIVTNRLLALPIFALVMLAIYYLSISTVGGMATDWVNEALFGGTVPAALTSFLVSINCAPWLISLIVDGMVAGVGAVLGFLPQIIMLFICLALLEDCGYMARVAFIMDKLFRKFGLSGKSFIPMIVATGCAVPAIMASRTIENENERKMTIVTTSFIPCGAKLPIIALIAGALFNGSVWVAVSAYFVGIAAIIVSGVILKKMRGFAGKPSPFVMELPPYHVPGAKGVAVHVWDRVKSFIIRAGTIILLASVIIWFLANFSWSFRMVADVEESILASIGHAIAPIFYPLGWGDWQFSVAAITGLAAKENVVGTLGVLYGFAEVSENGAEYWAALQASFTALAAYSFLIFNLLCAPCFGAIGAIRREMGSAKWTWIAVGYQTGFAYIIALCVYQLGMLLTGHGFNLGSLAAILAAILLLYLLFRPNSTKRRRLRGSTGHTTEAART